MGERDTRKGSTKGRGDTKGTGKPSQVWELDLASFRWRHVECKGATPPYRIHSSASAVVDKWLIHGGRKPGKFNVTNQTFVLDFATWR